MGRSSESPIPLSTKGRCTGSQKVHAGGACGGSNGVTRGATAANRAAGSGAGGLHPSPVTNNAAAAAIAHFTIGANGSGGLEGPTIVMSFLKNNRRTFQPGRPRFLLPHLSPTIVRVVFLAACSIAGAAWALQRHLTRQLPSLLAPANGTAADPSYDPDANEIPISDFEQGDGN
jgi:hypothetical protein